MSKYDLALGMFKSIVIFDQSNTIVLVGEEIKKVFDKAGLNIYTVIENHGQESEGNKLYRALQRVREDKLEMQPHTFTEIDKDFILFPANTNNYYNIILSTKDEIDQII